MTVSNRGFRDEETISRKIVLDLPNVKVSYKKYCQNTWKNKLKELASEKTQLNLVRIPPEHPTRAHLNDKPFLELQLLDYLYWIKFTIKNEEEKTFSISAENYLLYSIMTRFAKLWIPQYRKYELSQQLRYDIDEVFYAKIHRGKFWLFYFEKSEQTFLFDYIYTYVKYNRNVKYYRGDEMTKYWYEAIAKDQMMSDIKTEIRNIHYKERKTNNYLLFYLLYLTAYEWVELFIIYDNKEFLNCFTICDADWCKKYTDEWCTILWLYDTLINVFKLFWNKNEPVKPKWKIWCPVFDDILEASQKCKKFKFTVKWSDWQPTFWQIDFTDTDLKKYKELKEYAWEFWLVSPIKWTNDKKILDWKKKLNYKKSSKSNDNL